MSRSARRLCGGGIAIGGQLARGGGIIVHDGFPVEDD